MLSASPFVLSFIPSIKRIFVKSENATYTLSEISPLVERVKISKVIKQINGVSETYSIALVSDANNKITIAIPIKIAIVSQTVIRVLVIGIPKKVPITSGARCILIPSSAAYAVWTNVSMMYITISIF